MASTSSLRQGRDIRLRFILRESYSGPAAEGIRLRQGYGGQGPGVHRLGFAELTLIEACATDRDTTKGGAIDRNRPFESLRAGRTGVNWGRGRLSRGPRFLEKAGSPHPSAKTFNSKRHRRIEVWE